MIKNIIFDNGGVMVKSSSKSFIPLFKKYSNKPVHTMMQSYWEMARKLDTGYESEKSFYKRFSNHMELKCHWSTIHKIRYSIARLIPGTLNIVKNLSKKYPLYMLNNEYKEFMRFLQKKYNYFKYFKGRVTSYQAHCRKPDARIYKLLLEKYNLKPHESVFIDDKKENVRVARKIGMHAIHFRNANQLKSELGKIGVNI